MWQLFSWQALIQGRSRALVHLWLGLSLGLAISYGVLGWQEAFAGAYVVQDDARQHVFWMGRWIEAGAFPGDAIADYFQSVAPWGYKALYQLGAIARIDPITFNKLLPLPLSLITTIASFGVAMELCPVPIAGFITSLLLNQNQAFRGDIISGTPRAFLYPLFVAFLYFLLKRKLWPMIGFIVLQALFYPSYALVSMGMVALMPIGWKQGKFYLDRTGWKFAIAGIGAGLLAILPFSSSASEFGPTITAQVARQMPEFLAGGKNEFFTSDWVKYWIFGRPSGVFPKSLFSPVTLMTGLVLPVILRFPNRFPTVRSFQKLSSLIQILAVTLGFFVLSHAVLFKLHLPSRYANHGISLVLILAAGLVMTAAIERLIASPRSLWKLGISGAIALLLLGYPLLTERFPVTGYTIGKEPALYEFLKTQPRDSVIASLSREADYVPTFARRSVLVGKEYGIPYHVGYYKLYRQRLLDLIAAQYTRDRTRLQTFTKTYRINLWLLDKSAFQLNDLTQNRWLMQYPVVTNAAIATLQQGPPLLQMSLQRCQRFESANVVVVDAICAIGDRGD